MQYVSHRHNVKYSENQSKRDENAVFSRHVPGLAQQTEVFGKQRVIAELQLEPAHLGKAHHHRAREGEGEGGASGGGE